MRIVYFILLVLVGVVACPYVSLSASGDTTYATSPIPATCGQTLRGTLGQGAPIHTRLYYAGTDSIVYSPWGNIGSQDVYRIRLDTAGNLNLKQYFRSPHVLYVGSDSSNRSIIACGTELSTFLQTGTYYVTVVSSWTNWYSIEVLCNVSPGTAFGNAKLWAESGTNNGEIRTSLTHGANHLELYARNNPGSPGSPVFWDRRGPERIYKIELPEDRNIEISIYPPYYQSWFLIDSTGNPLDTIHHQPFGNVAAGTYYLSVEYDSLWAVDSVYIGIRTTYVPSACVPQLDSTDPFTPYPPWVGGLEGFINGFRIINPNSIEPPRGAAYTDRYLLDYVDLYLNTHNSIRITNPAAYLRVYVDFNEDGDFDDRGELVFKRNEKPHIPTPTPVNQDWSFNALTADNFFLSDTFASYRAALGKELRYRVLVTAIDTLGACGHYTRGIATDGHARLNRVPSGSAYFNTIQTLNDTKIARYKAVSPGPGESFYGAGETKGIEINNLAYERWGMSQIAVSDSTNSPSYYYSSSHHHSILGTNNIVTRYKADGQLAWYRILDGYANDGSRLGNGVVDVPGVALAPDSGITVLCHLEGGQVSVAGGDSATIGNLYSFEGYDRTLVVCYSPSGRLAMAQNFGSPKAPYNIRSCGYGTDGSLYMLGHSSYQQDAWWHSGGPHIQGPLGDTLGLKPRGKGDAILLKLLPNKRLGWMVNVAGRNQDNGLKLATAKQGRVYILGTFDTVATVTSTASTDSLVLRGNGAHSGYLVALSDSGQPLWARTWTISDSNWDYDPYNPQISVPIQLTTDAQGQNIVVAGGFRDQLTLDSTTLRSAGGLDAYGMGFDRDGHLRWAKSFGTNSDEEVSALTPEPDGMLRVGINYTTSINHVFGDGVLEAASWSNVAILRVDPATGSLVHGPGFVRFSGFDSLSLYGLHALPNGKMLVAGYSGAATFLPGWGMLCHEGFIGMTDMVADTMPFVVPTVVQKPSLGSATLNVYPNPSTGQIFVRNEQATVRMPVIVLDAQGRVLVTAEGEATELRAGYALPVQLQPGFYLVRCGAAISRVVVH